MARWKVMKLVYRECVSGTYILILGFEDGN